MKELQKIIVDALVAIETEDEALLPDLTQKSQENMKAKASIIAKAISTQGYVDSDKVMLSWADKFNVSLKAMFELYAEDMGYIKSKDITKSINDMIKLRAVINRYETKHREISDAEDSALREE